MSLALENTHLRIELCNKTGGFRSVFDKRQGREYVGAPDRALLLRLMTPDGEVHCRHVDADDPDIRIEEDSATLGYALEGIEAGISLKLDGDAILASMRVTNNGPFNVEETIFPWLRGLAPMEGASIIWPEFWARRIDNLFVPKGTQSAYAGLGGDHHTWNEWTQKRTARYPEHLTTGWCDYGDRKGGIALEGRHTDFSIMDFFVHKIVEKAHAPSAEDPIRRSLDLAVSHPRRVKPGETWESPNVRIVVHEGDWHVVADQHRDWLDGWIGKPDRPAKFAKAVGWHFYFMKHQDGVELNTYEDLPRMAEAALAAGCPYLLVFGWQMGGHDNNYLYRYVPNDAWGGVEALRTALKKAGFLTRDPREKERKKYGLAGARKRFQFSKR